MRCHNPRARTCRLQKKQENCDFLDGLERQGMHGLAAAAVGLADVVAGTLIFTHGGEWNRILQLNQALSSVDVGDLWLVCRSVVCTNLLARSCLQMRAKYQPHYVSQVITT